MKAFRYLLLGSLGACLAGCGGGNEDAMVVPAAPNPNAAQATSITAPTTPAPVAAMPAPDQLTAAPVQSNTPDPLDTFKKDPLNGSTKSDLEALQAAVDAYAFGPDGLGAPPLKSLDELVTKKVLKRLPTPPDGKQWAYDSVKWKVSLADK